MNPAGNTRGGILGHAVRVARSLTRGSGAEPP